MTRAAHSMHTRPDGSVLAVGGYNDLVYNDTTETFNTTTGLWTLNVARLNAGRGEHAAHDLANGNILVSGGAGLDANGDDAVIASAEIYDQALGAWRTIPPMRAARSSHFLSRLPSGALFTAGGAWTADAQISESFDETTEQWTDAGSLSVPRYAMTQTGLGDGRILIAGGSSGVGQTLASADIYDSATSSYTSVPLAQARANHSATGMLGGRVLLAGGYDGANFTASTETFDLTTNISSLQARGMQVPRSIHSAIGGFGSGGVFVMGGVNTTAGALSDTEFGYPDDITLVSGQSTVETADQPLGTNVLSLLDNPLITTSVPLTTVPSQSGPVPQQIYVADSSSGGYINYHSDFWIYGSGGEGFPDINEMCSVAACADDLLMWPNRTGTFTAPTTLDLFARGLRVGYRTSIFGAYTLYPDSSAHELSSEAVQIALDPSVELVPIEVVVFYSDDFPLDDSRLDTQLPYWDQVQLPTNVFSATDGNGDVTSVQRTLPAWTNPSSAPPPDHGLYLVKRQYTPDSIWGPLSNARCHAQFRLVNYFEIHTDNDHTNINPEINDPQSACTGNANIVAQDPRHVPGTAVFIVMQHLADDEYGRTLIGLDTACVNRWSDLGSAPTTIAHELGHMSGRPDNGCSTPPGMMCSNAPTPPPFDSECDAMNSWAATKSAFFAR